MKDENKNKSVDEHLEQQFQQLNSDSAPPNELEESVFNTLDTMLLFGDFIDLFTTKFTDTEAKFLDTLADDSKPKHQEDS